jgi:aspartate/glutamate racemase
VGGRGEWNIKRSLFQVIEATSELGTVAMAVPSNTAKLVAERLSHAPR